MTSIVKLCAVKQNFSSGTWAAIANFSPDKLQLVLICNFFHKFHKTHPLVEQVCKLFGIKFYGRNECNVAGIFCNRRTEK